MRGGNHHLTLYVLPQSYNEKLKELHLESTNSSFDVPSCVSYGTKPFVKPQGCHSSQREINGNHFEGCRPNTLFEVGKSEYYMGRAYKTGGGKRSHNLTLDVSSPLYNMKLKEIHLDSIVS